MLLAILTIYSLTGTTNYLKDIRVPSRGAGYYSRGKCYVMRGQDYCLIFRRFEFMHNI